MNLVSSLRATLLLCLVSLTVHAQGFLPPPAPSTATVSSSQRPLLIGNTIPESLKVATEDGKERTLMSYKSAIEVLMVTFISARCQEGQMPWAALRRLTEDYKDWRVTFLAVDASSSDNGAFLANLLKRERLSWPVVVDPRHAARDLLNISGTPEVLIVDEFGSLRYRGPVSSAKGALEAVIGHLDPVKVPEPPLSGGCPL